MNKILIVILVLGAGALAYYLLGGNTHGLQPGVEIDENTNIEIVKKELSEPGKRTVYGSCNDIANSSNCIDYIGSMWNENDSAKLNCGEGRIFSINACPYSEFGGCQMNSGSVMDMISWVYKEGPGEYTEESVQYAAKACNSVPNGKWVTPSNLLR